LWLKKLKGKRVLRRPSMAGKIILKCNFGKEVVSMLTGLN